MKKTIKSVGILTCLALLFLFVSQVLAPWRYNPFTRKLDYYSMDVGGAIVGEAAGDVLYHDGTNWTNLTAGADGLVLTLNTGLPTWMAGDAFTVKVDADATAGYFGVAGGDGIFRFTANHFTMADGGSFVTLSLADSATARTALGLGTGNDAQFADVYHTDFLGTDYYDCGNSGASITIDWNNGNIQFITLTAVGVDITFTEPPHPGKCELWIIQDGTGNRTIDWAHEVNPEWPGGVAPTLSTGGADVDVVAFTFIGGTTYRGLFNGNFE